MARNKPSSPPRGVRRIPQQSALYERVVPIALILLAVLMAVVVVIALGILVGIIQFGPQ